MSQAIAERQDWEFACYEDEYSNQTICLGLIDRVQGKGYAQPRFVIEDGELVRYLDLYDDDEEYLSSNGESLSWEEGFERLGSSGDAQKYLVDSMRGLLSSKSTREASSLRRVINKLDKQLKERKEQASQEAEFDLFGFGEN